MKGEGLPSASALCEQLNAALRDSEQDISEVVRGLEGISDSNAQQLRQLAEIAQEGAALVATYRVQAPTDPLSDDTPRRGERLVGHVPAGSSFHVLSEEQVAPPGPENQCTEVLYLRLKQVQRYSSTTSFLGNLPPMRRSLQSCHNRASGRLAHLAGVGPQPDEGYGALHNKDLEWLVHNWLVLTGKCAVLYAGSSSDEDVDHKGWAQDGGLVLGQTTRTKQHVEEKLEKLSGVAAPGATRLLFCPQAAVPEQLPPGVDVVHLEEVYQFISEHRAGRWMLEALLTPQPL